MDLIKEIIGHKTSGENHFTPEKNSSKNGKFAIFSIFQFEHILHCYKFTEVQGLETKILARLMKFLDDKDMDNLIYKSLEKARLSSSDISTVLL